MAKKLKIRFRCLCFFVRDEKTGQMHVVTPATCGCEGGVVKHAAFLAFPKEGGRLNDAGLFKEKGEPGKADFVPMDGFSMVLPGNGTPAVLDLRPSTVDLNGLAKDAVNPALARGPRDPRITSRITLPSGKMSSTVTPGDWDFNGKKKLGLARDVVWTIDGLPDEPLVIRRSAFAVGEEPGPEEEVVEIKPNSKGEFRLEFHHAMEGDFGRDVKTVDPNEASRHFVAFYGLYDQPVGRPLPKFVSAVDVGVVGCLGAVGTVRDPE
jgi:hypothetical protein